MLFSDGIMISGFSISVELFHLPTSYVCHLYYWVFTWGFLTDVMHPPTKMVQILEEQRIVYSGMLSYLGAEVLSSCMPPSNPQVTMGMNLLASQVLNDNNFYILYLLEAQGIVFNVVYTC